VGRVGGGVGTNNCIGRNKASDIECVMMARCIQGCSCIDGGMLTVVVVVEEVVVEEEVGGGGGGGVGTTFCSNGT
jgi:hypothetical protein